jgi:hypothetical protein
MKTQANEQKHKSGLLIKALETLAVGAIIIGSVVPANAVAKVANISRSNVKNNFVISQLGPDGTAVSSPFLLTGIDGLQVTGSFSGSGNGEVRQEGVDWTGNFAVADSLLWTNGQGPITCSLSSGVELFGNQLQADFYGPFVASIAYYDSNNNLLGYFTEAGVRNGNEDNSAIFLGVQDSVPEISTVVFGIASCTQDCADFAVNDLGYAATVTPESGLLLLFGSGVLDLGGYLRRRLLG